MIGPPLWATVQNEIETTRTSTNDADITVVTWDQFIYASARTFARDIAVVKWFDWLDEDRPLRENQRPEPLHRPGPTSINTPSRDELRDAVLHYLKSADATSENRALYRSQLRPALVRDTRELQAASVLPAFAHSFKGVLDGAIKDGLIAQECLVPGKERIWIVESPHVIAPPAVSSGPAPRHESVAAENIAKAPTYERTAEFRRRLTALGIFCEKRERDVLMEGLAQILKTGPQPISRLRRELPKIAISIAESRNVCAAADFKRIANFFLKLLLVSGALTGEGNVRIERSARAESTAVNGLADDAMDIVESHLLEQILKKSDVKDREHWQLASALFREFDQSVSMDEKLDRVAALVGGLSNRVVLTDDGTYEYTGNVATPIRALRA
jgi:hypothetical protein